MSHRVVCVPIESALAAPKSYRGKAREEWIAT
jgi:hypothetical protein